MQGEFRGDVSRDTFDRFKHFTRVLMQQGRVQVDADWNEQVAILLHYIRALAVDVFGEHGGPGFEISPILKNDQFDNLGVGFGNYYVAGILCENEAKLDSAGRPVTVSFYDQPDYNPDRGKVEEKLPDLPLLVYLDVWERHITYLEDIGFPLSPSSPTIREVALGGADTATRAKIVWQVLAPRLDKIEVPGGTVDYPTKLKTVLEELNSAGTDAAKLAAARKKLNDLADEIRNKLVVLTDATLRARTRQGQTPDTPCTIAPQSRYRGAENQLYRVEIHRGGEGVPAADASNPKGDRGKFATFKWSRENASIALPIRKIEGATVTLASLGRDDRSSLQVDDWVEVVDDDLALRGQPGPLFQVDTIEPLDMTVTLKSPDDANPPAYDEDSTSHPLLRRWDHQKREGTLDKGGVELNQGAIILTNGDVTNDTNWITLEDGVQVQFSAAGRYRSGDYWLIPARTATGDVEWPKMKKPNSDELIAAPVKPHGIEHHYAPLAGVFLSPANAVKVEDLRHKLK